MDFQSLEKYENSKCLLINEVEDISYLQLANKSDQIVNCLPKRSIFALFFYPSSGWGFFWG